jgi:hypothetical protein
MNVAGGFHLTYCSNIHPGETWSEVSSALAAALPRVRGLLGFEGPFAVGLRLSAQAAEALEAPSALAAFRDFLREGNYYVLTINGFPYGAFHGQRVKEQVYRPDWRDAARLDYANRLARLLAALLSDRPDIEGSVSTVPGAFRAHVTGDADVTVMATQMLRHAFFHARLFDAALVARVARDARVMMTVEDVRRHVGICFDACHMAVEFEEPSGALRRLREAGIRVCKVQISSALRVDRDDEAAMRALVPFAEGTYLHQVVERSTSGLTRYVDLPEALAATAIPAAVHSAEWRVHFHVPIFLSAMNSFDTTQADLAAVLDALKRDPVCPYLEVETYTWDVLPAEYRTGEVCTAIARELTWVRAQLEA